MLFWYHFVYGLFDITNIETDVSQSVSFNVYTVELSIADNLGIN